MLTPPLQLNPSSSHRLPQRYSYVIMLCIGALYMKYIHIQCTCTCIDVQNCTCKCTVHHIHVYMYMYMWCNEIADTCNISGISCHALLVANYPITVNAGIPCSESSQQRGNWSIGFVVHLLNAAMNLAPYGSLCKM